MDFFVFSFPVSVRLFDGVGGDFRNVPGYYFFIFMRNY